MAVSIEDLNACIGKSAGLLIGRQKVLKISNIMKSNECFIPSLHDLIRYRCKRFG